MRPDSTLGGALTSERTLARWGYLSAVALAVLGAARLWAQWMTLGGSEAGPFAETMRPMLFETIWGLALIAQVVLGVAASVAFALIPRRGAWATAGALAILLCITPGLSGHAVAESRPTLGVTLDTLHVIAGGIWLGTLTILVALAFPVLGDATARKAVHALLVRFARLALSAAAALALTGLYAAWVHLGSWSALWSSSYGRALLLKLCTVALAGVLGTVNWRVAVPRFTLGRVPLFAASGTAEVLMALLIYLLTAAFVARPLPLE
ncbi:MAG TPA: CopD family protein [Gemmatimonadaceae bacterium]|nr:CopD family protein [Gemmatimonadaceae bacterium]